MPDTFFTASPHWTWWIILYFFVGGIAGGAVMLATLLRFFGAPEDQPIARLGYYLGLGGAIVSGVLLTIDLERPLRLGSLIFLSLFYRPLLSRLSRSELVMCFTKAQGSQSYSLNRAAFRLVGN